MMRGAKPSLMLRIGKLFPPALVRGRPLTTLPPFLLRRYPFPHIHPLNNLPPLILIACLLACFLGVVQSERSLLGGDPSLNYQESTKLFTPQQEVLWKSSSGISSSFTHFSTALLSQFSAKWAEDDLNCCGGQFAPSRLDVCSSALLKNPGGL